MPSTATQGSSGKTCGTGCWRPCPALKSAEGRSAGNTPLPAKLKGASIVMGQLLSNLPNGSVVKLNENGQARKFIKLDNDHYGTGTGVTLIRRDAFSEIAWNASDANAYKNRYFGCTMDNFCDGIWPLKLDEEIRECMVPVPIIVAEGNNVATLHTIYRKGFALSCTEAGVNGWQTEGKAFSYFADDSKRVSYLDGTATAVDWGLRSPISGASNAYRITAAGSVYNIGVVYGANFAPRPGFNLKSTIVVSNAPDSDGCYTVESLPVNSGGVYVKQNGVWVRAN